MDEEQKEKLIRLVRLTSELNKTMDEFFPRDPYGKFQESSRVVTKAEIDEALKLAREIERILKGFSMP